MSKHYTAHNDRQINEFVNNHLNEIRSKVISIMKHDVEAIILSGGFGRGEGSILQRDDKSLHVVNDYDIDIIYKHRINNFLSKIYTHLRYRRKINDIANKLAKNLDIKQIDLNLKSKNELQPQKEPRLCDYDLSHGHIVLYGNKSILNNLPKYDKSLIPSFEGTWLLRNRGIGLLLADFYINNGSISESKREFFYIEINKAILAMGDALFILKGRYTCLYATRYDLIEEVFDNDVPNRAQLIQLYKNSSKYKLYPCNEMHEKYNGIELYKLVCDLYCDFFLYYESRRLNQVFNSIPDYNNFVCKEPIKGKFKYKLRDLFENIIGRSYRSPSNFIYLKLDKTRSVAATMTLIFNYAGRINDDDFMPNLTKLLGNKTACDFSPVELKRLFLLLIHPKGELGNTLR